MWGTIKEGFASSSEIAKAQLDPGTNELIKAAIADLETSEGRVSVKEALQKGYSGTKPAELVQRSLANLRQVSAILDAKAPGDAQAFKTWLRGISEKVAEAASEGGFLGIGGVQVNDAEKATLADIIQGSRHRHLDRLLIRREDLCTSGPLRTSLAKAQMSIRVRVNPRLTNLLPCAGDQDDTLLSFA